MDFSILTSYSFLVVALGTTVLGIASGMVGCVSVLKGQSLIGDAIGHSTFPGIVLAFMIMQTRSPLVLMIGAFIAGALAFAITGVIDGYSKIKMDTSLAVVLSSLFGFGMVLKSYIQGNAKFAGASQSGLQNYIFGQAAYMMKADVHLIFVVSIIAIVLLLAFYKEIKLFVFDPQFAKTAGFSPNTISVIILIMTMVLISTGLKAVGAILISAMLIAPGAASLQWSNRFSRVLCLSAVVGGMSAFIGTWISTVNKGMSTGPSIVLVMSAIALLSMIISPSGLLMTSIRRNKHKKLIKQDYREVE